MPDLVTRSRHEEEIAALLLLLFGEWQDRPWDAKAFEDQLVGTLSGTLASVYAESGRQFVDLYAPGIDPNVVAVNAERWEVRFLPILAAELASTTEPGRTGAFSPARAEMAAITEVTRAISAAEFGIAGYLATVDDPEVTGAVSDAELGIAGYLATVDDPGLRKLLVPIWYTALDERVCPICAPLHRTGKEVWGKMFPLGPPAHPRGRCWLTWELSVEVSSF